MQRLAIAALVLGVACGGADSTQPVVAQLTLARTSDTVAVGTSLTLTVTARDASGTVVGSPAVAWSVSDTSMAALSPSGSSATIIGKQVGTVTVTARVENRAANAPLTIAAVPAAFLSVTASGNSPYAAIGSLLQLAATPHDAAGAPLTSAQTGNRPVTWTSSDNSIATVGSPDGLVAGRKIGKATITASLDGVRGAYPVIVTPELATMRGHVVTADGGPLTALTVSERVLDPALTISFDGTPDASGGFSLLTPVSRTGAAWLGDTVVSIIDVTSGPRAYRPFWTRTLGAASSALMNAILIPRQVTIPSGTYAGARVPVSTDDAFLPVCDGGMVVGCTGYYDQQWLNSTTVWAESDLPVRVVIDRSGGAVSAADSVTMWANLRRMEADLGRSLFRPANYSDVGALDAFGIASQAIIVKLDTRLIVPAEVVWEWDSSAILKGARISLGSALTLADAGGITHDFMHALGFGDTCSWPSVMGAVECIGKQSLTANDVAAFWLGYFVRRAELANQATGVWRRSLDGERMIELGKAPNTYLDGPQVARVGVAAHLR